MAPKPSSPARRHVPGDTTASCRRASPNGACGIDAEYFARIEKALGADGVEIRMHDDDRDRMPLVIVPIYTAGGTDDGSFGVLMPIGGGA